MIITTEFYGDVGGMIKVLGIFGVSSAMLLCFMFQINTLYSTLSHLYD
ncbi:hypothetical protein H1P_2400004 [Hyella patelloides LEGE 07179]|uniref:Uncharacterized protein n=1 Tax=Hyella patelloides LEGE 07179 TaxID=945734 RepID=A0A563VRU2_9CYAN|nr:hypothetical protein H1P_2400004 [Hyella patelloides LEGE 07179]